MNALAGRGDAAESVWGRDAGWQAAEGRPRPIYDRVQVIRDQRDRLIKRKGCPMDRALDPEMHDRIDDLIARLDALLARLGSDTDIPPEVQDAEQIRAWAKHASEADNRAGRSR